jgi:hypothetical protein
MDKDVGIADGCVFSFVDHFSLDSGHIFTDEVDTDEGYEDCGE